MNTQIILNYSINTLICVYGVRSIAIVLLLLRELWMYQIELKKGFELESPDAIVKFVQGLPGAMGRNIEKYLFFLRRSRQILIPREYFPGIVPDDVINECTGRRNRLILLGLLGTFLGLAHSIYNIVIVSGDITSILGSIKAAQEGMKTAFSASIFGLSGSILLGVAMDHTMKRDMRLVTLIEDFCIKKLIPFFGPQPIDRVAEREEARKVQSGPAV